VPSSDLITTSVTYEEGVAVVTVAGDVDLATVPTFEAAIAEAVTHNPATLIVDLSAVDFLASAGLQALVASKERISKTADFAVVANGPATSRPIQLTGLDQILSLHPTMADAMAALDTGSDSAN